jgi:outer membrane protein TolC
MHALDYRIFFPLLTVALVAFAPPAIARNRSPVRIGMVFDGPSEVNDRLLNELRHEVEALFTGDTQATLEPSRQLTADWTLPTIRADIDKLIADRSVAVVIGAGLVASNELAHRRKLTKPAFAPFLLDPQTQKPSGARNLAVIYGLSGMKDDLTNFHRLFPDRAITVMLDPLYWTAVPEIKASLAVFSKTLGESLDFADSGPVPTGTTALYFGPAPRQSLEAQNQVIAAATMAKIPTFSFWGKDTLGRGVLAAMGSDSEVNRFTRLMKRLASHLYRAINGEAPSSLASDWAPDTRLLINIATATKIGFHPNWETLRNAEAVGDVESAHPTRLSLENAIREAVDANLELRARGFQTEADAQGVAIARSHLLPSIEAGISARQIDSDRAANSFGLEPEKEADATATLTQAIFNERAWAALSIQGDQRKVAELKKDQARLDIIFQVSRAYLDCLKAGRMVAIQEADLTSSRTNLTLAHERRAAGAASLIDVYRWESEVARSQRQLNQAQAQRRVAEILLNRILHRPLSDALTLDDISYTDPRFLYRDKQIAPFFSNPWDYRTFSDFMVQEAFTYLPEVQAMDAVVSAQEREVTSVGRQHWLPTLALKADVDERLWSSGAGSGPTQITLPGLPPLTFPATSNTQWSIGVQASLPIFEGGLIESQRHQENARLEQYRAERGKVREEAERQVRALLEELRANSTAIALSETSSDSARKSYRLVRDAYSRGAAQMTSLVESQTNSTGADQAAAVAGYEFLEQLMELQRSVARFDFLLTPDEKKQTLDRLKTFFESRRSSPDVSSPH